MVFLYPPPSDFNGAEGIMECVIVEDQVLLADLLHNDLNDIPGIRVTGVAHDVNHGQTLCRRLRPDLLLMDLLLPDGEGVEVAEVLLRENPSARILVLSAQCERLSCSRRLHDAILAVIDKGSAIDTLHGIVKRQVREATPPREPVVGPLHSLTKREQEVFRLIGQGLSSTEIAERLQISLLTARTHRRNITAKLGVTRSELVLLAYEQMRTPA